MSSLNFNQRPSGGHHGGHYQGMHHGGHHQGGHHGGHHHGGGHHGSHSGGHHGGHHQGMHHGYGQGNYGVPFVGGLLGGLALGSLASSPGYGGYPYPSPYPTAYYPYNGYPYPYPY